MGREIRDVCAESSPAIALTLVGATEEETGLLTELEGEPAVVGRLDAFHLAGAGVALLAGTPQGSRKAVELAGDTALIDVTYANEDHPRARLRAPMAEPPGYRAPAGAIHVIAHPAAIALALVLNRMQGGAPIRRSVAHVFEPASERGRDGVDELQQQTVSIFSFKNQPRAVFDTQLAFNLLARYGDEAPQALADFELRIERHLATLLAHGCGAPLPSLRLIQAPVFHAYSISLWVELENNPGTAALEAILAGGPIDLRTADLAPPDNVGAAGQSGVMVGAIAVDRNAPGAVWVWVVADNLRLMAENAVLVAKELL